MGWDLPCSFIRCPYARTRQTDTAPAAKAKAYEIRVSIGEDEFMAASLDQGRIVEHQGRTASNPFFQLLSQGVRRYSLRDRPLATGV